MGRELNKDLFESSDMSAASNAVSANSKVPSPPHFPGWASPAPEPVPHFLREEDWKLMQTQVEELKRRSKDQDETLESTNRKLNELATASKVRIERLSAATMRLEEYVKSSMQELNAKLATVMSKVNERKLSENQIQELIDRHTHIVRNFEVRLNQLQKVVSDQEMQIMNSREAVQEAQREMARMKRF